MSEVDIDVVLSRALNEVGDTLLVQSLTGVGHILLVQRVKDQVSNAFLVLIDVIVQDFDLGRSHYLLRLGDHDAISLKRCYPVADALVGFVRLVHLVDRETNELSVNNGVRAVEGVVRRIYAAYERGALIIQVVGDR